jgi:DNA-binding transcriptional LysR family regulator
MVSLDQLRGFVEVARRGSFTAAARDLSITQPSLTRRLASLEKSLGTPLFVRTRTGVVPTEAGERFMDHALRALASIDAGREALAELEGELRGTVSVGAVPTVGAYLLPDVLARFCGMHPNVRLRLREDLHTELEDSVAKGEIDLALLNMPLRRAELVVRRLWTEDYVLAVHETHRFASSRTAISLRDIAREPLLIVPVSPASHALAVASERNGVALHVVVEADNHEALRRMVARGIGVAIFPRIMAAGGPSQLRYLEIGDATLRRRVALVTHGTAYLGAAARALRDAIVAHVGKQASRL